MTCPRCQGCLAENWNTDLRCVEVHCIQCGHYPQWTVKVPPVENRGKHERESRVHSCQCGRPKVPWRSSCAKCLIRLAQNSQRKRMEERTRATQSMRKEMEA